MSGKCPGCGNSVFQPKLSGCVIRASGTQKWNGVQYLCPSCNTILGVGIDPVALKTDTIDGVIAALKKLLRL